MIKSIIAILLCLPFLVKAQDSASVSNDRGWHLKDKQTDSVYGISLDKAYEFLAQHNRKAKKKNKVIVGIIDSGVDTLHQDLVSVLWLNPKEDKKKYNGKDDDKNGYIDDVYGWNFIGNANGKNVNKDSYEVIRVYHQFKATYANVTDTATIADKKQYHNWLAAKKEVESYSTDEKKQQVANMKLMVNGLTKADSVLRKAMGKEEFTGAELKNASLTGMAETVKNQVLGFLQMSQQMETTNKKYLKEMTDYVNGEQQKASAMTTPPIAYRNDVVKDNYSDFNDNHYGNHDVMAASATHGTHVAGIIGAARNNGLGMDGVADNVALMAVRAVPDGDEHDKDIALAIRYAVDNGAKVINMSFGKALSPEKSWVDEAVKYAAAHDVLLVHAAGNEGENLDSTSNFPTDKLDDGTRASNWITVGASGDVKEGGIVAPFSNYGKKDVDVFAPGLRIYSTVPGIDKYEFLQGTSMASPVVAGIAALIRSYYPKLTAVQVKEIIEKSVVKVPEKVIKPGTPDQYVTLDDLCRTGGIVNAYEAVKLAETY
ncbi:Subtilase family protein [bacterium A37T11]|nr:Subtilase family protein [bacterium A37T11]